MEGENPILIEMFYTLTCPNCKILKRMLDEVLPQFENKFVLKKSLASSPMGMIRTLKLGIHAVPALLINNRLVFRSVPTKEELINKLNSC
ncbi:MAG: thioredoxin family protein [Lentimicrobiaceae bacterium]|nr:thioredoxin family protein [Lentimicrobiaceae bacterium]